MRRCNYVGDADDPRYEYYPLIEVGWDRKRCIAEIEKESWPVPHKSSCFFCPSTQPREVDELSANHLRRIVLMEARAKPRLEKIEGLWASVLDLSAARHFTRYATLRDGDLVG